MVPLDFSYFRWVCQTKPIRHANEGLVFLVVCILLLSVEDCHASTNPFDLSIAHAFDHWAITNCKRPVSGWRLETVPTTSPPTKSQQTDWQNQSNSQPKWTFQQPKNNRNKCQLDQEWQMTQLELPKWTKLWSQAPWRCGNCNGDNDTQSKWQTQDKQYTNRKNESEL